MRIPGFWETVSFPAYLLGAGIWHGVKATGRGVKWAVKGRKAHDRPTTHGDSQPADYAVFSAKGLTEPNGGFLLGWTEKRGLTGKTISRVYSHHEAGAIIYGGRGTGKTYLIRSNIYDLAYWDPDKLPDLMVVDGKGKLEPEFRGFLERLGYDVAQFNIGDPQRSIRWDPLSSLDPNSESFENDVNQLASLILPDDKQERFRHFIVLPRRLLVGSIIYHMKCEPHRATLDYCLQAIVQELEVLKKQTEKWARLANNPRIANAITVSKVVADREFSGFITTMTDKFDAFLGESWRAVTRPGGEWRRDEDGTPWNDPRDGKNYWHVDPGGRGWNFDKLYRRKRPQALFVNPGLGGTEASGANLRLLFGLAVEERWRATRDDPNFSFPKKLFMFVDETADQGYVQPFVKVQRNMRESGINLFLTFTTRTDLFQCYDKDAKALTSGMAEIFAGGINDRETLEYASWMGGQKTVWGKSRSSNGMGDSTSEHEVGVRTFTPDAIYGLDENHWYALNNRTAAILERPFTFKKDGRGQSHALYGNFGGSGSAFHT
jgi:TraM recognition site of TraD and TraG/Type IV secretory system Conjugative DNA transfer